jgi:hypothetical protein
MTNNLLRVLGKQASYLNELEARGRAKDGRDLLLQRLMAGVRWMDAQHKAWIDDQPGAASDVRFSTALEAWDLLERKLRQEYGYEGCIFGPGQHCPTDSVVNCDFCAGRL